MGQLIFILSDWNICYVLCELTVFSTALNIFYLSTTNKIHKLRTVMPSKDKI